MSTDGIVDALGLPATVGDGDGLLGPNQVRRSTLILEQSLEQHPNGFDQNDSVSASPILYNKKDTILDKPVALTIRLYQM